jgi:hypothetical protein
MLSRQNTLLIVILVIAFAFIWLLIWRNNRAGASVDGFKALPKQISFNFHVKPILSDKCFACHGPDAVKREAGLRFDIEASAKGELPESPGKFAILSGKADESELVKRVFSSDPDLQMPPSDSNLKLTEEEKEILKKWIEQGATYEKHWAFVAPKKGEIPEVKKADWPENEIDYYILNKIEERGLKPSQEASAEKLLRRISLDITGLPPSPEDAEKFISSEGTLDRDKAIDHYLSQPGYGEKMTRDWLDVARYADSHGYQDDSYRTMWPWRDWVIHAFNENIPYDKFLTYQIAGDLLPDANKATILATGFNRNHPITQEGGVIDEEYRSTYVSDRTNTLGKGILGITLECAKCHDHKYDPFSQKDYFSLYAFFNQVNEKGLQMDAVQAKNQKYYADAPYINISDADMKGILSFINKPDTGTIKLMVMNDSAARETFVLERGAYDLPTNKVNAVAPKDILEFSAEYPQNRLGLATWLTEKRNPLTARVYVNRLWAMIFGQGIVKTIEDFGSQGSLPTHPELLDWLAVDFVENGWDIKYIMKKIMSSATYAQSSRLTPELKEKDPENILLARGPRFRLSAEEVRDYALATSGLLNTEVGGPSVKPYQPPGLWEETNAGGNRGILTNYVQDSGEKLYRRSLYTFWKRTLPPPSMTLFDAPNRDLCEVRRQKTNTPLQALAMQNDEQILECARVLSTEIASKTHGEEAIPEVFQRILLRKPASNELEVLSGYYDEYLDKFRNNPEVAAKILNAGLYPATTSDSAESAALMMVSQVLYNLDETISKE